MGIMYLIYFAELTKKEISISFQRSEVENSYAAGHKLQELLME